MAGRTRKRKQSEGQYDGPCPGGRPRLRYVPAGLVRGAPERVHLGRKHEIALGQPVNFVGPNGDPHFAPGQIDVRVMPLRDKTSSRPRVSIHVTLVQHLNRRSGRLP